MDKKTIICRCQDVTRQDIESALEEGCTTLEEIKRYLRIGMGTCQGRTCLPLAAQILAKEINKPLDDIEMPTSRPPLEPTPLYLFTGGAGDEK